MISNAVNYKGYKSFVRYDAENDRLYGKIEGIKTYVDYVVEDGMTVDQAFHEAVDDYLAYCNDAGIAPESPFSGKFNVRVGTDLHAAAAEKAETDQMTLNQVVCEALKMYLKPKHSVRYSSSAV